MGMWRRRASRHQNASFGPAGFTLIEVMVALAIVALTLVPLLRLHLLSMDATIYTQDFTTAVLLAQEKISAVPAKPEEGEENGGFDDPAYARFTWQTVIGEREEVTLGESTEPIGVQRIEVTVTWEDGSRRNAYTLETYAVQ